MNRVLTCYYRPKPGGFCKRLERAIRAVMVRECEVHYVAVVPFDIDDPHFQFHRFPWPKRWSDNMLFWCAFALAAPVYIAWLTARFRITHLFAFGTTYAFLMQPARLLLRIPLTVFVRADVIRNHQLNKRCSAMVIAEWLIEGLGIAGSRLYGVSRDLTNSVVERHRRLRPGVFGVLPNDLPESHSTILRRSHRPGPLRLACVGILEPRKNQELLIRAMSALQPGQAVLRLFGTGPQLDGLRKLVAELGITDRVVFMGWVDPAEAIWSETDVLLSPSIHEGMSNSILEAVSEGIPVIASDIPEHREFLPPSNLVNMALDDWLKKLRGLANGDCENLARLVKDQAETTSRLRFDWNNEIVDLILR
jgi:glycosyltransferase involved in cell wall biosynthesis